MVIFRYIVLIIIFSLFSCTLEVRKQTALIVKEINIVNEKEANYVIADQDRYGKFSTRIAFTDSIGKFSVGDTLILIKK